MGFFLRKSFSFGPIRMNLSKSGVGFSAGVTGARIGVTSQGKTYVAGGRHGLYFKENLAKKDRYAKISRTHSGRSTEDAFSLEEGDGTITSPNFDSYHEEETWEKAPSDWQKWEKERTGQEKGIFFGSILGFFFLGILVSGWFFWGIFLPIIYNITIPSKRAQKLREIKSIVLRENYNADIANANLNRAGVTYPNRSSQDGNIQRISELIQDLKNFPEILNPYLYLLIEASLPISAEDTLWDEEEKETIGILYNQCSDPNKEEIIIKFLGMHAYEYSLDHRLDEREVAFLQDTMEIFNIQGSAREKLESLIELFETLDKIRYATELQEIQPSIPISSSQETIYREETANILNPKSRTIRESGKVFLSSSHLHIVTGGHRKISLDHILQQEIQTPFSKEWILTIRGRKTPLIVECDKAIVFFVLLERITEG